MGNKCTYNPESVTVVPLPFGCAPVIEVKPHKGMTVEDVLIAAKLEYRETTVYCSTRHPEAVVKGTRDHLVYPGDEVFIPHFFAS